MLWAIVGHVSPVPIAAGTRERSRGTPREAEQWSDDEVPEAHRHDRRCNPRGARGHHGRRRDRRRRRRASPPHPRRGPSARAQRRAARSQPAAGHASNPIAAAARYLGLAPARLRAELRSGDSLAQIAEATPGKSLGGLTTAVLVARQARLASQLASGRLTEAQQHGRLATLAQRTSEQLSRPGPATATASLKWAARYLGTNRRALRSDLRGGESLAAIAQAQGKSVDGLIAAIAAAERARLQAHRAKGSISRAQEQKPARGPRSAGRGDRAERARRCEHPRRSSTRGGRRPAIAPLPQALSSAALRKSCRRAL